MGKPVGKQILAVCGVSVALVALAGCGTSSSAVSTTPTVLHLAQQSDVPTLDPALWQDGVSLIYMHMIYDTLVQYGQNNAKFEPDLATSWNVLHTGKTYVFHLRKGVHFSNGDLFTASDVQYDFQRLTSKQAAAPYGASFSEIVGYNAWNSGHASSLTGVKVLGTYTVEFNLKAPVGYFLNTMALEAAAIGDPKVEQKYGFPQYSNYAVGTGPYMLKTWVHNKYIDLVANPNYWGTPKPTIKAVDTVIGPNPHLQLLMFEKGTIDITPAPPGILSTDYLTIQSNPSLRKAYHRAPAVGVWYVGFNVTHKPFDQVAVRQAVNDVIDKRAIIRDVTNGRGTIENDGLFAPGIPGYNSHARLQYPYNTSKAETALSKVGITPAHPISINLATWNDPDAEKIATLVAADLAKVGINATIKSMDFNTYLTFLSSYKNPYDMFVAAWGEDYPDPQDFFFNLFDKSNFGTTNNSFWTNPAFQSLITQADNMPSTQEAQRIKIYNEANTILVKAAPWAFLYYPWSDVLVQPWVKFNNLGDVGLGPIYPLDAQYLKLVSH